MADPEVPATMYLWVAADETESPVGMLAGCYLRAVDEVAWTAIGLLVATLFGTLFYLGGRIDSLGSRIDARIDGLSTRIDGLPGRIDGLSAQIGSHLEQYASWPPPRSRRR